MSTNSHAMRSKRPRDANHAPTRRRRLAGRPGRGLSRRRIGIGPTSCSPGRAHDPDTYDFESDDLVSGLPSEREIDPEFDELGDLDLQVDALSAHVRREAWDRSGDDEAQNAW
jgi:hypothetical protein